MSTWIFICKTNTDFNFGWNNIWQRGWPGLAIFSSKYWNSSPVMELYKRLTVHCSMTLYSFKIVCSHPDVFETNDFGLDKKNANFVISADWLTEAGQRYQYSLITWSAPIRLLLGPKLLCFFAVWPNFCTTWCFVTFSSLCGCCGQRGQPTS